tara:strand:- start:840 stop:1343 length:504 start_codon:yes stop_codon:yes gene_type:complete
MEERTQIKFSSPDIEGNPKPQLITLDQETPIEGTGERENGEPFTYHKWLCTGLQYFMASDSLDGMLKLIPNKTGKPLKIEKVVNPKGGFPFFQINGMNKDDIVKKVADATPSIEPINPVMPPQIETAPASNTDGALSRLEQKLDQILGLLSEVDEDLPKLVEEELPF